MPEKLIFATNNKHKIEEASYILKDLYTIVSLEEIGFRDDIPETASTLDGNASLKARHIFSLYGKDCFADDTGLEVEVLNGEPGVYSARYAGSAHNFDLNVTKLLMNMQGSTNRKAQFRTVISLITGGQEYLFEGIVKGEIVSERRGSHGFGYDPVFVPEGYNRTMAEMDPALKNKISHRARALQQMADFIKSR